MTDAASDPWLDALAAATLFAVDPSLGVALRAPAGPVRDHWLAHARAGIPPTAPWRRVPLGIADSRLLGGLDLSATLVAGRPVAERGLLAEADGGVVVLAMAERLPAATAGRLALVLDGGEVAVASVAHSSRLGVIALDEGVAADEQPPAGLLDRLGLHLDLSGVAPAAAPVAPPPDAIAAARALLPRIRIGDDLLEALCGTALALGVASLRAPLFAARAARAAAALAGRSEVTPADAALAARLVLAPRATRLPSAAPPAAEAEPPPPPPDRRDDAEEAPSPEQLDGMLLAAARAAMPAGVLAQLAASAGKPRGHAEGRVGAPVSAGPRGRPAGVRAGEPRGGARLSVIETLRAAAPWQAIRRAESGDGTRLAIRKADFRVIHRKQRSETTTIFVVDASGSSALNRLAEAKGAVELLLADCYVRRDRVAVLAFRGRKAELLLPPTRSLVRAKRSLAALPGGGGTPLAAGIDAAALLADGVRRKGGSPTLVLLTDGRANVARDGSGGRQRAEAEALAAARMVCAAGLTGLLIDTSPRPQPLARELATRMGARYLPLPYANAAMLSQAVRGSATRS
jgi:magnesium chelatase subunit D